MANISTGAKSYATRELRKINSEFTVDRRIWTRGGDCELIDSQEDLNAVCDYVLLAQDSISHDHWY